MNIKDIAKMANVSTTTVSRVLNNSGYVSPTTRAKVMEIINKVNFVPNGIARNLSTKANNNIGVVIPDVANAFFANLIKGIEIVAKANGFNIVLFDSDESLETELASLEIAESQRMKGLILTPVIDDSPQTLKHLSRLEKMGTSIVLVDRELKSSNIDGIFVDNISSSREAVNHLINVGHQKIAIITGPDTSLPGKDRLKGYLQALNSANIPIRNEYITKGNFKIDLAYECMENLLRLPEPPTAIFSSNNQTTLGALKSILSHGYEIGKNISVIGFDQLEVLRIIDYRLSTIDRNVENQGKVATSLLLDKIKTNNRHSKGNKFYIPYTIVLRGSEKIDPSLLK